MGMNRVPMTPRTHPMAGVFGQSGSTPRGAATEAAVSV